MAPMRNVDRSRLVFVAVVAAATIASVVRVAIMTFLAATALATEPIFPLAVAASSLGIFGLVTSLVILGLFLCRSTRGLLLVAWIPSAATCLASTVVTVVALTSALHLTTSDHVTSSTPDLAAAGLAIAIIGLIPEAAFYVLVFPRSSERIDVTSPEQVEHRSLPNDAPSRPSITVHLATLSPSKVFFTTSPRSPALSAFSSSPRSSFRHSAISALRPVTSRTRLIFGSSTTLRDSRSSNDLAAEPRANDGFEDWDTSQVEESHENPFSNKTQLETIPGSRPVSPAHPLDGPFAVELEAQDTPLPESPSQSSVASPCSENGSFNGLPRPGPRSASAASNPNDQSHIHPLFRTESPVPPPLTSPGTVITASPYAGQVVSPEQAIVGPHLLGTSGPASPLLFPVKSRANSMRSFRGGRLSPVDHDPMPDFRSQSQMSRPLTPLAIPRAASRSGSVKSFRSTAPISPIEHHEALPEFPRSYSSISDIRSRSQLSGATQQTSPVSPDD